MMREVLEDARRFLWLHDDVLIEQDPIKLIRELTHALAVTVEELRDARALAHELQAERSTSRKPQGSRKPKRRKSKRRQPERRAR
jgi:hypothetical protein